MNEAAKIKTTERAERFVEGVDYYFENGLMILTARFLLKRGYCCRNDCRNCPFTLKEDRISQQKNG